MAATDTSQPEVRALAKWVRISPRKARLVTEHIRGRTVPEARTILAFTPRAAAREIDKVLRSAVANAEANHGLIGDDLVVSSAVVDEGVTLKRFRPQSRGRAHRIRKRTCHITISLRPLDGAVDTERRRRKQDQVPATEAPAAVEDAEVTEASEVTDAVAADEVEATSEHSAEEAPAEEAPAEEVDAEEKPKRRSRRRRKPDAQPESESEGES
jgi:ribosomal protein L22